jgi:tRNA_anti-like
MKRILIFGLVGLAIAAALGWYFYNKPTSRSLTNAPDLTVSAPDLLKAFTDNEASAMATYAKEGTVVQVNGVVRSIDRSEPTKVTLVLETGDALAGVACEFEPAFAPDRKVGTQVSVKGACTGFLMDVVLTRCAIVE